METAASFEARYAPLPYPTNQVDLGGDFDVSGDRSVYQDLAFVGQPGGLSWTQEKNAQRAHRRRPKT